MAELSTQDVEQGPQQRRRRLGLALGALGVVYGDIGTSPLYAIRECFSGFHGQSLAVSWQLHVWEVLSLVTWSLILVVVVKYLTFVMRADNRGEGGILALLALLLPGSNGERGQGDQASTKAQPTGQARTVLGYKRILTMLGLLAAALLLADGMITPAISVLGAIEGLEIVTPHLPQHWVVAITIVILIGLFTVQKHGTHRIAAMFGPVMIVWFATLTVMGVVWIVRAPQVLAALSPHYAVALIIDDPKGAFMLLGAVVLVVTGAEALYADMGHFGRGPIRFSWYSLVFPALLINYMGQGAFILDRVSQGVPLQSFDAESGFKMVNVFYSMVGPAFLWPVLGIATLAAIIASQALISGAYSLAQQAVQLGFSPRLATVHTSHLMIGQVYVPEMNTLLLLGSVSLVLGFRSASGLAAAYGIAVTGTMTITSILMYAVAREKWGWGRLPALAMTSLFLAIDLPFLCSNLTKFASGGWFPLAIAAIVFIVMSTWYRGRALLSTPMYSVSLPIELFLTDIDRQKPTRVEGTAVFMTARPDIVPSVLLHHFKHNRVLHERVILLTLQTRPVPKVYPDERLHIRDLGRGFFQVRAVSGFMQAPDVPQLLQSCERLGLTVDPNQASFYMGRMTLLTTGRGRMWRWRKRLFSFLYHNERAATDFFNLPPNRVVELGRQVEL